jgi:hypothetical protein
MKEYGLKMVSSLLQKMPLLKMVPLFKRHHPARLSLSTSSGRSAAFILVGLITGIISCSDKTSSPLPALPEILGGLELKETVVGVKANKFLYRMHGAVTGSRNSVIGYYSLDKKNALYISAFTDDEQAAKALEKMVAKIKHSKAGFTPVTLDMQEGRSVYQTKGMGLHHFFYRTDNLILWWQAEPEKAEETLTGLLKEKLRTH